MRERLDRVDERITTWMAGHGVLYLRRSLGIVFAWFGTLKLFAGLSPAEDLAGRTISWVSGGLIDPLQGVFVLGMWEVLIGLGLLTGWAMRTTLLLLFAQMPGTLLPLFVFPDEAFFRPPLALTLLGQYMIKNLVLVSSGIVLGATVRGGDLRAEP